MVASIVRKIKSALLLAWHADDVLTQARIHGAGPVARGDSDLMFHLLFNAVHDLDNALPIASVQTQDVFSEQWENLPQGRYLLSDPEFKRQVADILAREELQLDRNWIADKQVLDAGCGNGRWSYGFAELGANLTSVDINPVAIEKTKQALADFDRPKRFEVSPLEEIGEALAGETYDLVFSWGVVHHCRSFNQALDNLCRLVRNGGVLFLYLYGRESLPIEADIALFKERLRYNLLPTREAKRQFLLDKAGGNEREVHNYHDTYAPLINRRLDYDYVRDFLETRGFGVIERVKDHTELWIRAVKGDDDEPIRGAVLPPPAKPYWFQR